MLRLRLMRFFLISYQLTSGIQADEIVLATDAEEAAFTFLRERPLVVILGVYDYRV